MFLDERSVHILHELLKSPHAKAKEPEEKFSLSKTLQSKISEELSRVDDYDIIVSTTLVPDNIKNRVIDGVPLLTGFGKEAMFEKLKSRY